MPWQKRISDNELYLNEVNSTGTVIDEAPPIQIVSEDYPDIAIDFDEDLQVLVFTDRDGRKFYLINDAEWQWAFPNRPWTRRGRDYDYDPEDGPLAVLTFGQVWPEYVLMWAKTRSAGWGGGFSIEDSLEEAAGFVKDHWPGRMISNEELQELVTEAYDELAEEASEEDTSDIDEDHLKEQAYEKATEDLTYTESGYIGSDEWSIFFEPDTQDHYEYIRSLQEAAYVASRAMHPDDDDPHWEPRESRKPKHTGPF